MKRKILALSLFSLCCAGLFVAPARAGIFSPWCCHNRYTTQITCRPYNAFTPICWGNLVCDGCCPSPCGVASGCLPMNMGIPPWACNYGGQGGPSMGAPCGGGACGADGCCASDMMPMQMPPQMQMMPQMQMPMQMMPQMQMPDIRTQPFMPPMPMQMPPQMQQPPGPNLTMGYLPMQNGIAQANYYQNYQPSSYPSYYPNYAMPAPTGYYPTPSWPASAIPYYWYGSSR